MALTARDRYNRGLPFERPAVLKMKRGWIALGPGLPFMGYMSYPNARWKDALNAANRAAILG